MRSYRIDMDILANRLIPHYLGGRKLVLFVQSLLSPLDKLNKWWEEWAYEKRMEAAMTSQPILMENYLTRKFKKYLTDPNGRITITDTPLNGVPLYWQSSGSMADSPVMYQQSEGKQTVFRWQDERTDFGDASFTVNCPAIRTGSISQKEMAAMITYRVKQYCLAGKKFIVTFE